MLTRDSSDIDDHPPSTSSPQQLRAYNLQKLQLLSQSSHTVNQNATRKRHHRRAPRAPRHSRHRSPPPTLPQLTLETLPTPQQKRQTTPLRILTQRSLLNGHASQLGRHHALRSQHNGRQPNPRRRVRSVICARSQHRTGSSEFINLSPREES